MAMALFAGLHVVATTWESVSAGGFDSLRYHSVQSTLPFCILIVLVLMRPVRTRVISLVERVPDPWCSERRIGMLATLLIVGGGAAFLAWPSAVQLLGDGYLLLRDLPFGTSRFPGCILWPGRHLCSPGEEAASCFRKVLELDLGYSKGAAIRRWLGEGEVK